MQLANVMREFLLPRPKASCQIRSNSFLESLKMKTLLIAVALVCLSVPVEASHHRKCHCKPVCVCTTCTCCKPAPICAAPVAPNCAAPAPTCTGPSCTAPSIRRPYVPPPGSIHKTPKK